MNCINKFISIDIANILDIEACHIWYDYDCYNNTAIKGGYHYYKILQHEYNPDMFIYSHQQYVGLYDNLGDIIPLYQITPDMFIYYHQQYVGYMIIWETLYLYIKLYNIVYILRMLIAKYQIVFPLESDWLDISFIFHKHRLSFFSDTK